MPIMLRAWIVLPKNLVPSGDGYSRKNGVIYVNGIHGLTQTGIPVMSSMNRVVPVKVWKIRTNTPTVDPFIKRMGLP